MKTYITSANPIKQAITKALKKQTGADKVTMVYQIGANQFQGNCFKHVGSRQYQDLGTHTVTVNITASPEAN